jgi:hypothetical protein
MVGCHGTLVAGLRQKCFPGTMQKRYQVFVSSTFEDLKEERREIMQALLELRCFPAGMELFPASNENAWSLIRRVIDDSDYYVVVVAGRYGSVDPESNLSFTEKEFDYAVEAGKPILAFLHGAPGQIPGDKLEQKDSGKERLARFREKIESKFHAKYWRDAPDLGSKLSRAVATIKEDQPEEGWIRGRHALNDEQAKEVLNLQMHVKELEEKLQAITPLSAVDRAASLGPVAHWILRRIVCQGCNHVHCLSDGSHLDFDYYPAARSDQFKVTDNRTRALIREAIGQLKSGSLVDELRADTFQPSAVAYAAGVEPIPKGSGCPIEGIATYTPTPTRVVRARIA